jgi:hypothetical protein
MFENRVLSLHQQPTQRRCTFFQRLSARLAPALVPFLELVRARIRNTRGIENGISLNRDTNTIEALAALHISSPHMMHTESRPARHGAETVDVGNHAAPVTIRRKRHGRDRDRITRALPACNCTKGPRNWNTDYRERYPHRHTPVTGARKDANNPRPESERGCNIWSGLIQN